MVTIIASVTQKNTDGYKNLESRSGKKPPFTGQNEKSKAAILCFVVPKEA
jgi:hypothetical protein